MGSCAAPSAKGDDKFITTDYLQQCRLDYVQMAIQRLIGFGKKEEFKEILAILRRQNPDRIRVL
ncbi:putative replicase [Acinetobacter baumannii 940793]|nr:putative replicase [Acinetobacter baumannii 1237893]EXH98426.1 putative replicase [Acinetobacter baumannii 480175]EXS53041.1 putative replicase [Acinetobacter baumannii 1406589]KCX02015.1 putative replicase [Acinetobacter baumannii 45075_4]KCX80894.1 putative replicase [Acinetobacter baumannii 940793]